MNNKNIIIAGAIAIGLYIFSHMKKILPMTHPSEWRDMTPAQRAAYTRRTTLTTMAEKIKALKEAIKRKSADENTPIGKTKLTPEEQEIVLRGLELRKEAEKGQGTGFDYVRERAPLNKAILIRSKKIARKIPSVGTPAGRRRMAEKIEETRNRKIKVRKATAQRIAQRIAQKIAQKVAQKVASPTPHKTTYSSWTPTAWPVRTAHKKSTLFDYSKPQKDIDLSVLHTAIKWRRARIPQRPKSTIRKVTLNKSSTDKRKKMQEIISRRKYQLYWLRPRRHVAIRRR